jgi:hypothetical protein
MNLPSFDLSQHQQVLGMLIIALPGYAFMLHRAMVKIRRRHSYRRD